MPSIGPMELIVVLVIALVVLGPKRLPDVGRSVGRGMREFKRSLAGENDHQDLDREPDATLHELPTGSVETEQTPSAA